MSKTSVKQNEKHLLKVGNWYFAPRLKLTAITILLISILVYLSLWQVGRAYEKQNIFHNLQKQSQAEPIQLSDLKEPSLENNRYTPITTEGVYLNNYTILIDNQMHDHKTGYRVITPMHVPHLDKWILVDRGWVATGASRAELPKIDVVFGMKKITGVINTIGSGIVLQKDKAVEHIKWPIVLQNLNYELITTQLHHPIYDFTLQLNEKQPGSYEYGKITYGISSEKHFGYALEWFLLALLLLTYYVVVSTKRRS